MSLETCRPSERSTDLRRDWCCWPFQSCSLNQLQEILTGQHGFPQWQTEWPSREGKTTSGHISHHFLKHVRSSCNRTSSVLCTQGQTHYRTWRRNCFSEVLHFNIESSLSKSIPGGQPWSNHVFTQTYRVHFLKSCICSSSVQSFSFSPRGTSKYW